MTKIEPKIEIPKIELDYAENHGDQADDVFKYLGPKMPVVQINDYVLPSADVNNFSYRVEYNKYPTFQLSVNDENQSIRKALNNVEIDTCVIFLGFKEWYIKFEGLILFTDISTSGNINIIGELKIPKLQNRNQLSFVDKTPEDILKSIVENTDIGLYTYDNPQLGNVYEYVVMSNKKYESFIPFLVENYTNNLWMIDMFYYLHVSDIETLRNKTEPDTYSLRYDGTIGNELPIVLTNAKTRDDGTGHREANLTDEGVVEDDDVDNPDNEFKKISFNYIGESINNGNVFTQSDENYFLNDIEISSTLNKKIGNDSIIKNTFSEFQNSFRPFYNNILSKNLSGKLFEVLLETPIYEITPFTLIKLELYHHYTSGDKKPLFDEENSGIKIVIGYSMQYNKRLDDDNATKITQKLILI